MPREPEITQGIIDHLVATGTLTSDILKRFNDNPNLGAPAMQKIVSAHNNAQWGEPKLTDDSVYESTPQLLAEREAIRRENAERRGLIINTTINEIEATYNAVKKRKGAFSDFAIAVSSIVDLSNQLLISDGTTKKLEVDFSDIQINWENFENIHITQMIGADTYVTLKIESIEEG